MSGLLKFITCGSVDDGKSTLVGHILYDAKLLYADQEKALELDSKVGSRGGAIDYSLLLDGLMAEREQGITIDVAYRYFTTDNRSFIVADTPGHEEYTRNMAVGASFADLAVILIDAKQGVLVQTRRHARICSLMGIRHFVFAVNKIDLVDYDHRRFDEIKKQIDELVQELSLPYVMIIPVSATAGDNITKKSKNTPWYEGDPLLTYLEKVDVNTSAAEKGFYMPVQRVCRPNHEFRGFQGQIESGSLSVGDTIKTLPSNEKALVKSIHIGSVTTNKAIKGQPVTIQLNKEVDVSRGCVLLDGTEIGTNNHFGATILWMDDEPLQVGKDYLVKLGTKLIPGIVSAITYRIDVNDGAHKAAAILSKNEIAYCDIVLSEKIALAEFVDHKTLGELILIDRITNMTSACGIVEKLDRGAGKFITKPVFVYKELQARGNIFEEFYYNLDSQTILKYSEDHSSYTLGDVIPVKGKSYAYPDSFDILILRDTVAVKVRQQKISVIESLDDYVYSGYPIVNGRGFAVKVFTDDDINRFLKDYSQCKEKEDQGDLFNKWMTFDTYRTVIFQNSEWYWSI